jgi:ABC transport system ATP-binding/permease protein
VIAPLSGGERRRIALAKALLDDPELLLLDEPTNHLDVEGVDWLARFLAARRGTLLVITHDRWFLDAVCTQTWEVGDGTIRQYEGGYAAYVLARAERDRQASVREERRQMLVRKELAWLRRGPPARTSKPKFRIEAANALIEDVPEPRDRAELLRFAARRLGNKVLEAEDLRLSYNKPILTGVTWRLGPGDRVALVGVNGSGKTSLVRILEGTQAPDGGRVERGQTVRVAHLSQDTAEIPPELNVLESLEAVRGRTTTSAGEELTAGMLAERFGFRGERARTKVKDLSGGERRRLQLMRLLMDEPNVLLLDEPTNDLDIDTLTALEDLLDGWPGTLLVVSHDRYFVERVTDNVYALMGDGLLRHLPGGIEQYLELRRADEAALEAAQASAASAAVPDSTPRLSGGAARDLRREIARLERQLDRLTERETELHDAMAAAATEPSKLQSLNADLRALADERDETEAAWLEAQERLEG